MVPPTSFRPALVAVTMLLVGLLLSPIGAPVGSAGPAASGLPAAEGDPTPLTVRIHSLSPSTVPRTGPVRVTGTVTNDDDVPWTAVRVYAFVGDAPLTSPAELAQAADVEPEQPVGERITDPGTYDTLDVLEPGQTSRFSLTVPRSRLPSDAPGVYWFGVHALGSDGGPVETVPTADGRARTFLPLLSPRAEEVETAVVLELRRQVVRSADGSVADLEDWVRALGPGGRLDGLLDIASGAGARPLTWLVDPAVLAALGDLAAGNGPRSLAPTVEEPGGPDDGDTGGEPSEPAQSGPGTPSASPSDEGPDDEGAEESPDPQVVAASQAATSWLARWRDLASTGQVLALPYGDVDVAAAAEHDPALYRAARERSTRLMAAWELDATPAVAPAEGYLDVEGLLLVEDGTTVLVGDQMLTSSAAVTTLGGQRLIATSSGAAAGGPGPDDEGALVALRQRILAEAALRTGPRGGSVVVRIPDGTRDARARAFFEGLDAEWVELTDVRDVASDPAVPLTTDDLRYPEEQQERELGAESFALARALIRAGTALQNILPRNDVVGTVVADQALAGLSYSARSHGGVALASLADSRVWIEDLLQSIEITAPRGVTLSSSSGRFAATLSNGLDQPVTVDVEALADDPLEVSVPEPVTIPAGGRTTVLLRAHTDRVGVHSVTLLVTDDAGTPLGSTDRLPVRSAQVSDVIWVIIGVGGALLLVAIVLRLVRRLRRRREAPA